MKIQNKKEIDLTEEDIKNILYEYLYKEHGDGEYSFKFKVVNKPIRSGMYDSMDNHVFDSIQVIITNVSQRNKE
jgi:hypothetical protein